MFGPILRPAKRIFDPWFRLFGAGVWVGLALQGHPAEFGFTGPETFPIDDFISLLRAADLDGDGLTDLVVVNNSRSRINLLYNRTGKTNAPAPPLVVRPNVNELPPDARFRVESLASEKRVAGLVVEDLDGNGRPDLAYYGDPKELIVHFNEGRDDWGVPKQWPIEDGLLTPNALTAGDLNGDGRRDLILLGEKSIYWLAQTADHGLAEPEQIPYSGTVKSVQALDINADGREDLLLVDWDSPHPFRFRLQDSRGRLGPEIYFSMPPIRSYWADDLDADGRTEIVTVARNSGRLQIWNFVRKPAEPLSGAFTRSQFQVQPLTRTGQPRRGMAWSDVNGDGLADLLVAEPESGQMNVALQRSDGGLGQSVALPALTGVSELAVLGKEAESGLTGVYLLSAQERQVGVMHFDRSGMASFPAPTGLEGKPLAMAVGPFRPDEQPGLAVILEQEQKRVLILRPPHGQLRTVALSSGFKSNPSAMAFHDVNQDGRADLVVLIPYEKVKILLQSEGGGFTEEDIAPPGGIVEQPWFSTADVDGDGRSELLLAQRNFVRAVLLEKGESSGQSDTSRWAFRVKDQINGASSRSRIVAAAALPNGTNRVPSLFLLDAERGALTLCERDGQGIWRVLRNLSLPFSEFAQMQPLALGGTRLNSVAFFGPAAAAALLLEGPSWELVELDGYETQVKDGRLNDIVSGDLNNDRRKDLVLLESARHFLELVLFEPGGKLAPVTRWQVFEERTFRARQRGNPEPREALVADLTGDGKNDLAVIVHDRVLVYPQE